MADGLTRRPTQIALLGVAAAVLIGIALIVGSTGRGPSVGASPSPPIVVSPNASTATPGPSPIGQAPYRLSVLGQQGSPGPTITVSTTSDCDPLPSEWLRHVCGLALGSSWQAMIGPNDPFGDPTSGTGSPTWWAAQERATIDGDTSLCSDASMETWISAGSHLGGAPEPGSTPSPVHPIAGCIDFFRRTAATGSFQINDQESGNPSMSVEVYVDPGAAAEAADGVAPAFDPYVACDLRSLTRDLCNQMIAGVSTALGNSQSQVQTLYAQSVPAECVNSASPCPPPAGFVGSVLAGPTNKTEFAFDVIRSGGQLHVSVVPYKP